MPVHVLLLDSTTGFYLQRDLLTAREAVAADSGRYSIPNEAVARAAAWNSNGATFADYVFPDGAHNDAKTAPIVVATAYQPWIRPDAGSL